MPPMRSATLAALTLAFGLSLAACTTQAPPADKAAAPAAPAAPVSSTAEVLARHQKTFGASDLEGVMADYAPDAVMFTPGGPVKGADELRKTFQTLFAEWGKPTTKFELKKETVDGKFAYMFWNAETGDNLYEAGQDAFVVENGKIVAHFFSAKITAKKK
jgi:ketosteroid isomerase-like protein